MRVVYFEEATGTVVLNFMFLPTFIGQNPIIQKELRRELSALFAKRPATPALMDEIHRWVITWLSSKFSQIPGLEKYLKAIEEVQDADTSTG
jgi:hypothetical protein